ncbi:allatostatin-A receptor-like [Patiria miniata]|uniref:G-protein coupled receptors family 1 profile domain-containing protein n=1 Tax=Patiria miniata TaxID=46514 RepID=A0A914BLD7_PATMI|nr:allatostatin-A receptor-like [Patiria miniata]
MTTVSYADDEAGDRGWSAEGSFEDQVWLRAVYGVIAVLGITGNALVMFTVARVPSLRSLTNMFIVSLAVCDLITSVFLIPLHLGFEIPVPEGAAGDVMCRLLLSKYPLWTSFVASVLTLTCVTLERYSSIVHPFRYEIMSNLHKSAMTMRQSTSDGRENQLSRDLLRARKKVVKMLLTVVVTFAVCWAPNQFMFFAYMCGWNLDFSGWYYHASVLIAFCNSCMNPFIYGFQSKQHRKALRQAIGCKRACCSNVVGTRPSEGASNLSFVGTADVREYYADENAVTNPPMVRKNTESTSLCTGRIQEFTVDPTASNK